MGSIKQGILGGFSGKVGTVIGGTWKGIAYMRGIAPSHSDPNTDAQLVVRQKFAVTINFLKVMSQFIQHTYHYLAVGMTGINAAFKEIRANALTGTYPNIAINYAAALVSKGNLPAPLNQAAASTVAGTVAFTWDDNSDEIGASELDTTNLLVYNAVKKQAVTVTGLAARADGTQTVTVPDSWSGDLVQCYIAFETVPGDDNPMVSNSGFAGAVTVA